MKTGRIFLEQKKIFSDDLPITFMQSRGSKFTGIVTLVRSRQKLCSELLVWENAVDQQHQ